MISFVLSVRAENIKSKSRKKIAVKDAEGI